MSTEFRLKDRYLQDFMKTTEQDIEELKNDNLQLIQKVKDQEAVINFLRIENKALLPLYTATIPKDKSIFFISYLCSYYKFSIEDLKSGSRKGKLPYCRQLATYFLMKSFEWTRYEVKDFLQCDRSTIYHSVEKIEGLIDVDRIVLKDMLAHRDWLRKLNEINNES